VAMVCLLLLPVAEIFVLVQAGRLVGLLPVLAELLAALLLGVWITRLEIRRLLQAVNRKTAGPDGVVRLSKARTPEFADASLGILAGLLLALPGLISDLAALFLLVPAGRKLARRGIGRAASNWTAKMASRRGVVHGEIIDVQVQDVPPGSTPRPASPQEPRRLPPDGEGTPPG
jgi:UPF0716 family protein affecting phage T7 exclusion